MGSAASSLGFGVPLVIFVNGMLEEIYSDTDWFDYPT